MVRCFLVFAILFNLGCESPTGNKTTGSTKRSSTESTKSTKSENSGTKESTSQGEKTVLVKNTARAIIEKGAFDGTCVYGLNRSISDHAPVIFDNTATWNITYPVNHTKQPKGHYNHTFRVGNNGALVDEAGNQLLPELSEMTNNSPNSNYVLRLEHIAKKAKELFSNNSQLENMPVQELPFFSLKNENNHLQSELGPDLELLRAQRPKTGSTPNVGLIVRANSPNPMVPKTVDADLRFQSYCNDSAKNCIVSAHLPYTDTDDALRSRCTQIEKFVTDLYQMGYNQVEIAGDFNTDAQRIKQVCTSWQIEPPVIVTTAAKGSSCAGGNSGRVVANNIDLSMTFQKK